MKHILKTILCTLVALTGVSSYVVAQGASADVLGRIAISTYIPEQVEALNPSVGNILKNKMDQMISANGISGSDYERFIITANFAVVTKDLTATAPPMTALTLDVTFYIGDGFDGKKFSSKTITVKGADINETKAYISAIKNIKANDPALQAFVTDGKNKIINYYNGKCGQIVQQAQAYESQNKFEESLSLLSSIPQEAADCYNKALSLMPAVFKKAIDRSCKVKLAEANSIWNAGQNLTAANDAGAILVSIDPQSACYGDVKALFEKIGKRVLELDKREWNYKLDTEVNLNRDMIKAYRDVGVAYGNGQPKNVTYNVRGWW